MTADASPPPAAVSPQTITRLYISPLDPALLTSILPRPLQSAVSEISYHAPQTFPDKPYGYITLSTPEALKLKAKLHGAILRGVKMRVEEARPEKRRKKSIDEGHTLGDGSPTADVVSNDTARVEKLARREQRRLRKASENGVLPAVELQEGRSVQRGWSQSDAHKDPKTKRTKRIEHGGPKGEMVFRTHLPHNKASSTNKDKSPSTKKKKKSNAEAAKPGQAVEVTEFEKTTKYPSFLRDSQVNNDAKRAAEFVDGKGWVDEDGNVVEPVAEGRSTRRKHRLETPDASETPSRTRRKQSKEEQPRTIPGGSASSDKATTSVAEPDISTPTPTPPADAIVQPKPIHPLEALFKRPAPKTTATPNGAGVQHRPTPIKTSFSFFSSDQDDDNGQDGDFLGEGGPSMAPPQTPFTRQDMEMRGVRSAAPTPDTAAIGGRFSMPWRRDTGDGGGLNGRSSSDEDDDDDDNDVNDHDSDDDRNATRGPVAEETASSDEDDKGEAALESNAAEDGDKETPNADNEEQNEFEKHFWQHRGEYQRAWKARKREARKESRQSENRKRGIGGR